MKLDKNEVLKDINDNVVLTNSEDNSPAYLVTFVLQALLTFKEENSNDVVSYKLYDLAQRIHRAEDTVELAEEDANIVRFVVGKSFQPLIVGRVCEWLAGSE